MLLLLVLQVDFAIQVIFRVLLTLLVYIFKAQTRDYDTSEAVDESADIRLLVDYQLFFVVFFFFFSRSWFLHARCNISILRLAKHGSRSVVFQELFWHLLLEYDLQVRLGLVDYLICFGPLLRKRGDVNLSQEETECFYEFVDLSVELLGK